MSEAEQRNQFADKIRNLEPFKLTDVDRRFTTGEFVSVLAEMAYLGYKIRDEELNNGN